MAVNELTPGEQLREIIAKQRTNAFVRSTVLGAVLPLLDKYIERTDARIAALEGLLTPEQRRELLIQQRALEVVTHGARLGQVVPAIADERRPGGFMAGDQQR